jgi:gag-polypeptide of LTR copia-type/Zinc knuckle
MSEKTSFEKLSNENYEVWRVLMEALLTWKGLLDVGTGVTSPPTTGLNSSTMRSWQKKNAEARAKMILHVEADQLPHMTSSATAEIWAELEKMHRAKGLATRIAWRRRFYSMRMKRDHWMSSWIAEVRQIGFQLKQMGDAIDDEEHILVLTMGLPPSYYTFVGTLENIDNLTLNYVINRLLNEESRQLSRNSIMTNTTSTSSRATDSRDVALAVGPGRLPGPHVICYQCGEKGHFQANCPRLAKTPTTHQAVASPAGHAAVVIEAAEDSEGDGIWWMLGLRGWLFTLLLIFSFIPITCVLSALIPDLLTYSYQFIFILRSWGCVEIPFWVSMIFRLLFELR